MAELIQWKKEFETGIASIDNQHKKLVGYIQSMQKAMDAPDPLTEAYAIATSLVGYTRAHFKFEESLFERHGYPQEKSHCKHHNELVEQVKVVMEKLRRREEGVAEEVLPFLIKWLNDHILKEDMEYVQFFKDRGVQ